MLIKENEVKKKEIEAVKASLFEINEFISKLEPEIRSAAFELLADAHFGDGFVSKIKGETDRNAKSTNKNQDDTKANTDDLGAFISKFQHDKPADNVVLLAAWLYASYGVYPITAKEIKELGNSCGLITPGRSDNTMRQAKKSGKGLFNKQGKGWKPTVSGELYFKDTYGVTKGKKPLPTE